MTDAGNPIALVDAEDVDALARAVATMTEEQRAALMAEPAIQESLGKLFVEISEADRRLL